MLGSFAECLCRLKLCLGWHMLCVLWLAHALGDTIDDAPVWTRLTRTCSRQQRWALYLACRALMARTPSLCRTAKQTECSEEAWEIMLTFTSASRMVEKMVLAVPGTPTIPVPCKAWMLQLSCAGGHGSLAC